MKSYKKIVSLFLTLAMILVGSTAFAAPQTVIYGDANNALVEVDYAKAVDLAMEKDNNIMFEAFKTAFKDVLGTSTDIVVIENSGEVIDYKKALSDYVGYAKASKDEKYYATDKPETTKKLNEEGKIVDKEEALSIVEVEKVEPIIVPLGTGFKELPLPKTIKVTYSNGTTAELEVLDWPKDKGDKYDKEIAATYNLVAELALDDGVTYAEGVAPTVTVIVADSELHEAVDNYNKVHENLFTGKWIVNVNIKDAYKEQVESVCVKGKAANKISENQWRVTFEDEPELTNADIEVTIIEPIELATASLGTFEDTTVKVWTKEGIAITKVTANGEEASLDIESGKPYVIKLMGLKAGDTVKIVVTTPSGEFEKEVKIEQL